MRSLLVAVLWIGALGCSSKNSAAPSDGGNAAVTADDGSTAGCTAVGGRCDPVASPTCPPALQNPSLCGDVLLVCCIPPGGEVVSVPDAGGGSAPSDAGMTPRDAGQEPSPDASSSPDAPADAPSPPDDAPTD